MTIADPARDRAPAALRVIDLATMPEPVASALRRECLASVAATALVVDARNVAAISSATLAVLVRLRRREMARGGALILVAGDVVWDALRRTGLSYSLPCALTPQEALETLRSMS